jgi:ligand-binding sensor domain-containing protein/signal transduction histidine kinase
MPDFCGIPVQVMPLISSLFTRLVRGIRTASKQKWVILVVILGVPGLTRAEVPSTENDFIIDSWNVESGLPHNAILAITQSRDGYLWLGTSNGLTRFDGIRFASFHTADWPGLPSNRILSILEDRDGVLWIGTDAGLSRYEGGTFTALTMSDGLPSDAILSLGEDRAGNLWIGTSAGLARRVGTGESRRFRTEGLGEAEVNAICPGAGATVFLGTHRGLYQFNQDRVLAFPPAESLLREGRVIYCLGTAPGKSLWIGGHEGLSRVGTNGSVGVYPSTSQVSPIRALELGGAGEVWFGTEGGALYRVPAVGAAAEPVLVLRFSSTVTAVREDREGNWWVGTAGNGLHRLKRRQLCWVPFEEHPNDIGPLVAFQTLGGELQLLGADKHFYRYQDRRLLRGERVPLPDGVQVNTICQTRDASLWLGTVSDGLFEYQNGKVRQFGERDGLSDSGISVLCAAEEGGLWVGTRNGGLNYLEGDKVTRFNTPWGFRGGFAIALANDAGGKLWIGTSGEGLFQLNRGSFTSLTVSEGLPSNAVRTLHIDETGLVWIGTDQGLCRLEGDKIFHFSRRTGIEEDAVLQLRSDPQGNLWLGSGGGISRLNRYQLNACAEGHRPMVDSVPYGKEDGLPGAQLVAEIYSPSWQVGTRGVWFACAKGLIVLAPRPPVWNVLPAQVLLESVLVENEPVLLTDPIRVAPGKESLQFRYTAPSLVAPGKVLFRYQLEGYDREWSELTALRTARYPKLPPGQYRFRVTARNNDGIWNEVGAKMGLVVVPFWWATAWFRGGVGLAGLGVVASLYRLRRERQRELERLRVRIAGDLHDDIGSSLWSITLLSRMLSRHGALGAEEKQDINEIHAISVQASNSIRDIIWLINPSFDSLQDLALRLKDFAGTTLRGCKFEVDTEGVDLGKKLPLDFRQNLFFFLKEALANAARHAQATEVCVRIDERAGHWCFQVSDNGQGFATEALHTGHGLTNLRARAGKMKGALEIRSRPGKGTTVLLTTRAP